MAIKPPIQSRPLPAGWQLVKLSDVCLQDRHIVEPETQVAKELQYLSLENVESNTGTIRLGTDKDDDNIGQSTTFIFDSRHVLYGKLRPYLNKVALPDFKGRCTTELLPLLPRENTTREFLALILRRPETVSAAIRQKTGSRMPRADMNDLFRLKIPLPPLTDQQRIAAQFQNQLAAIEKARAASAAAEDQIAALFDRTLREAFHGITPLSLGTKSDPAPAGWVWHQLSKLARLESGHTPSRYCPEYWANGNIPWLALPDIRALDCRVATKTKEQTNALGIANSSARVLPAQTVCLSRTASVGFITIMGVPMATSQDFVNWVCGDQLAPEFLMWLLRASRKFIHSVSTGAIHQTVYMHTVERFQVCLPPLAEQRKIASRLNEQIGELRRLESALAGQTAELEALPNALLREAFNGHS